MLLIIGGGIAAYKSLELIRLLRRHGVMVLPVLTRAGAQFVTPLSVAALAGARVHEDLFSLTEEVEMGHIALARAADLVLVAPATADLIARVAAGMANDLATTLLLATTAPVLMAPAMNVRMWQHPATQRNVRQLQEDGVIFLGPEEGEMACGEEGPGRMVEPEDLARVVLERLETVRFRASTSSRKALQGRHVLITAGPTHEPIDPVRYIANRSSGRQGFVLAEAARDLGARVTLVHGPVALPCPTGVDCIGVETAEDMLEAVKDALPADVAIFAAAVADWKAKRMAKEKLKKTGVTQPFILELHENPDILSYVGHLENDRPCLVVGFAAETGDPISAAREKLKRKRADLIVANDVSPEKGVMGGGFNQVTLVSADGEETWPQMSKAEVARRLVERIVDILQNSGK